MHQTSNSPAHRMESSNENDQSQKAKTTGLFASMLKPIQADNTDAMAGSFKFNNPGGSFSLGKQNGESRSLFGGGNHNGGGGLFGGSKPSGGLFSAPPKNESNSILVSPTSLFSKNQVSDVVPAPQPLSSLFSKKIPAPDNNSCGKPAETPVESSPNLSTLPNSNQEPSTHHSTPPASPTVETTSLGELPTKTTEDASLILPSSLSTKAVSSTALKTPPPSSTRQEGVSRPLTSSPGLPTMLKTKATAASTSSHASLPVRTVCPPSALPPKLSPSSLSSATPSTVASTNITNSTAKVSPPAIVTSAAQKVNNATPQAASKSVPSKPTPTLAAANSSRVAVAPSANSLVSKPTPPQQPTKRQSSPPVPPNPQKRPLASSSTASKNMSSPPQPQQDGVRSFREQLNAAMNPLSEISQTVSNANSVVADLTNRRISTNEARERLSELEDQVDELSDRLASILLRTVETKVAFLIIRDHKFEGEMLETDRRTEEALDLLPSLIQALPVE